MNKYVKILIIVIGILVIISILNHFITPKMDVQIKNHLINLGYLENEDKTLFTKKESENKKNSFSIADYTFMQDSQLYSDSFYSSLNATYNYKDEKTIYNYRMTDETSANVLFNGSNSKDGFVCEKEFSTITFSTAKKESACNIIKSQIEIFELEAKTLFPNYKYIEYIKKNSY